MAEYMKAQCDAIRSDWENAGRPEDIDKYAVVWISLNSEDFRRKWNEGAR